MIQDQAALQPLPWLQELSRFGKLIAAFLFSATTYLGQYTMITHTNLLQNISQSFMLNSHFNLLSGGYITVV